MDLNPPFFTQTEDSSKLMHVRRPPSARRPVDVVVQYVTLVSKSVQTSANRVSWRWSGKLQPPPARSRKPVEPTPQSHHQNHRLPVRWSPRLKPAESRSPEALSRRFSELLHAAVHLFPGAAFVPPCSVSPWRFSAQTRSTASPIHVNKAARIGRRVSPRLQWGCRWHRLFNSSKEGAPTRAS
jgi:hypothetical protein